jgi:hypothetical protein
VRHRSYPWPSSNSALPIMCSFTNSPPRTGTATCTLHCLSRSKRDEQAERKKEREKIMGAFKDDRGT